MKKLFAVQDILLTLDSIKTRYEVSGNSSLDNLSFKSLRKIEPSGVYFFEGTTLVPSLTDSIVFCKDFAFSNGNNLQIRVEEPQLIFYKLMRDLFSNEQGLESGGVHSTAVIHPEASISDGAYIGPYCVIGKSTIRDGVRLHSHVVVMDDVLIEENVTVEPHSTLGATGVAWIWDVETGERVIQPQIGGVVIGSGSFLGSDITIVRGSVNDTTVIGSDVVIAHGTKIGHGCRVGAHSHFANNVSLGGNVTAGDRCFFSSSSVVRSMVTLASDTTVGAGAVVVKDVLHEHKVLMGVPAKESSSDKQKLAGVPTQH